MFQSVYPSDLTAFTVQQLMLCIMTSIILGMVVVYVHTIRNTYTRSFVVTVAILPLLVQAVIMLVNGNLGTGMAVLGAFSLVRFRSVAGGSREITSIFWSMAIGLATGMGYVAYIFFISAVVGICSLLFYRSNVLFRPAPEERVLKISIPEDLDYPGLFDDLFHLYTKETTLTTVKTTTMGSIYELRYQLILKENQNEKQFIDEIRVRNGNLPVMLGNVAMNRETL